MAKVWSDEIAEIANLVRNLAASVASDIKVVSVKEDAFIDDTFHLVLSNNESSEVHMLLTWEAAVNARSDPSELANQLREIASDFTSGQAPECVYVVTSDELMKRPVNSLPDDLADAAAVHEGRKSFREWLRDGIPSE